MKSDIHAFDNRAFTITTPDPKNPTQAVLTIDDGQSFIIRDSDDVLKNRKPGDRYDLDATGHGDATDYIPGPVIGAEADALLAAAKPLASPILGAPRDEHGNPTPAATTATTGATGGTTSGATSGVTDIAPAEHASNLLTLVAKVREDASLAEHWFVNEVESIAHKLRATL